MRIVEELSSFYRHIYLNLPGFTRLVGVDGARENAIDLKGLRDALRVRNTIIDRLEEAERLQGEFTDDLLTFDFVGGGPTGVEAVADSHDLIFDVLKGDYPDIDLERVRLVLVNSGDHILKGLDPSLVHAWRSDGSGLAAMRERDHAG
jgi:NADH:ubiquinone reductase (H+-translocating)